MVETDATLHRLPADKRPTVAEIVNALAALPGVRAIVLGGSYARGVAHLDSDVDLALYYRDQAPFSIDEVRRIAGSFDLGASPVVTNFYEWGPWVNGGAWVHTAIGKVDFLYRSLDHVERVIADAVAGRMERHYWQTPTYGFHNVIYLAETHCCVPLHDPSGALAPLKAAVRLYPPALKDTIVRESLWGAEFTMKFGRDFAAAGDVYNAVGCMTRTLCQLTQALFAVNEVYFITDQGSLEAIESFPLRPDRYSANVRAMLSRPGATPDELTRSMNRLASLVASVIELTHGRYQPKYSL